MPAVGNAMRFVFQLADEKSDTTDSQAKTAESEVAKFGMMFRFRITSLARVSQWRRLAHLRWGWLEMLKMVLPIVEIVLAIESTQFLHFVFFRQS
jgi:hypothetical protein